LVGKRWTLVVGTVLAGALSVLVLTGLAGAAGSAKQTRMEWMHAHGSRGERVNLGLMAHFEVLRRARTADVSQRFSAPVANSHVMKVLQLDLSRTQVVRTDSGPVWVVPGGEGACVMSGQASATIGPRPGQNYVNCDTTAGILHDGLVARASRADGWSIFFGLVPDGNRIVTITSARGAHRRIPVVNNVVRVTVAAGPATLGFRNAAGVAVSLRYRGLAGGQP
jgi:hypothetical protein